MGPKRPASRRCWSRARCYRRSIGGTVASPAARKDDHFDEVFHADSPRARATVDGAIRAWERVITNFNFDGGGNTYQLFLAMAQPQEDPYPFNGHSFFSNTS